MCVCGSQIAFCAFGFQVWPAHDYTQVLGVQVWPALDHTQVLVFSTWVDVLELLAHGLAANGLPFAYAKTTKAFHTELFRFKCESPSIRERNRKLDLPALRRVAIADLRASLC